MAYPVDTSYHKCYYDDTPTGRADWGPHDKGYSLAKWFTNECPLFPSYSGAGTLF